MRAIAFALLATLSPASTTADAPAAPVYSYTQEQMDKLQEELEAIVHRREKEAFEAGVRHQRQACRSLI